MRLTRYFGISFKRIENLQGRQIIVQDNKISLSRACGAPPRHREHVSAVTSDDATQPEITQREDKNADESNAHRRMIRQTHHQSPQPKPFPVEVISSTKRVKTVSARLVKGVIQVRVPSWMDTEQQDKSRGQHGRPH